MLLIQVSASLVALRVKQSEIRSLSEAMVGLAVAIESFPGRYTGRKQDQERHCCNCQIFVDSCGSQPPENIMQKTEPNPLLLKPNPVPPMVPAQLIVKGAFLGVQPREGPCFRLFLHSPE